jgi:NADPH2:quinone reductase
MKAWRVHEYGEYRAVLRLEDGASPAAPTGAAMRLRVLAAGVNFADSLSIAGKYQVKQPVPFTPGGEVCGDVLEAGPQSQFRSGDRVVAFGAAGAFAEETSVADRFAFRVPREIAPDQAAALVATYQTSHLALIRRAGLRAGETALIHSGAGGVGTAAIQIAKRLGARVIATAGSDAKLSVCTDCGADHVINYRARDFVVDVKAITGDRGADVIYDPVGGDTFDQSTRCIAWEGRLVVIGFTSGRIPSIAANRILLKNISVVGLNWPNYEFQNHQVLEGAHADIVRWYREGAVRPVIYAALPLAELPRALDLVLSRESYGKVVLVTHGA